LSAAAVLILAAALSAQQASVWDGVYSASQAKRGESLYLDRCVTCHGESLEGSDEAAALSGKQALVTYDGKPLSDLFVKIARDMPDDDPGSLSPDETADVLAYILKYDKFPAGDDDLPHSADGLSVIRYTAKKPPTK
jgi:mono/diheme cytochrome c family protein